MINLKAGKGKAKQKFALFKEKDLSFVQAKALKSANKLELVSNLILTANSSVKTTINLTKTV